MHNSLLPSLASQHARGDVAGKTDRRRTTGTGPGAALTAPPACAVPIEGTRATAWIPCDRLADEPLDQRPIRDSRSGLLAGLGGRRRSGGSSCWGLEGEIVAMHPALDLAQLDLAPFARLIAEEHQFRPFLESSDSIVCRSWASADADSRPGYVNWRCPLHRRCRGRRAKPLAFVGCRALGRW